MTRDATLLIHPAVESPATAATAAPPNLFDPDTLAAETIAHFGEDPDFVTALARGLAVLLALSDKKRRMSIAQISHRTGIPRAAARRSLHTLAKLGFVAADDARRYYLRPRVLSFSHAYLSASPLAVLAQPILDRLGESLREACSLAILDGDEIVYYLAHVRFHPYTEHTLTNADRLRETLDAVRTNGYAFASQQMETRLCTIAVPVRDSGGHYVAGMNVILQGRLLPAADMAEQFYRPLHEASMELGSLLLL